MAFDWLRRGGGDSMAAACKERRADRVDRVQSSMSDEAFGLINCFYDGVDNIVRDLAQEIAQEEGSYLPESPTTLAIEVHHVQEAGRRVVERLRDLLKSHNVPKDLEDAIRGMGECFDHQTSA